MTIRYLSLWKGVVIPIQPTRRQIMDEIVAMCADAYGVSVEDIRARNREPNKVAARQHAMFLLKQTGFLSLPQIARYLDRKDHTTVYHGIKAHQRKHSQGVAKIVEPLAGRRDIICEPGSIAA